MKVIAITGTPGTGKTTLAKKIAGKLGDCVVIDLSKIVEEKHLYRSIDRFGTKVADLSRLRDEINRVINEYKNAKYLILEGHLASDIPLRNAIAIVLRLNLMALKKRLIMRGYPVEKIRDDIVSEAIDYCGFSAANNYPRVYEFMSNDKKLESKVLGIINGKNVKGGAQINLLAELGGIIKENKKYAL